MVIITFFSTFLRKASLAFLAFSRQIAFFSLSVLWNGIGWIKIKYIMFDMLMTKRVNIIYNIN